MIRTACALTALAMLAGCTAGKLPWNAENVPAVANRCGLNGLTVESGGVVIGGLSAIGKEPSDARKIACFRRHIRVPSDFVVIYG